MTEPLEGFEWDLANISHVLRHGVTPGEVEEAAVRPHVVMPAETIQDEKRWKLFGKTAANRRLVVVFTIRQKRFRTVTAYPMNASERRKYAAQID